ncbi:MAG TPA: DUF6600 domain-containing protein [Bryobacteraceae bacterium]|nr:DUF6600 domain-containing protein [Bryobacteraceae bacterium]
MRSYRVLLLLAGAALFASAQDDPPGRVGRLSYLSGQVSFRPGDIEDWVQADLNRPLTTGDHLWTDEGARAELHIGAAALRLNSRTSFEFLNLDDTRAQIRLAEGSLFIRLRNLGNDESFEIDTPNLAFSLLRPGDYRIDVNPDRETTTVTVRGGEGEVTGSGQAFTVHSRDQAEVSATGDGLSYNVLGAPPLDEWDNWCLARDRREDQSASARYVSREMVGYQDLDDNGDWQTVAEYGPVWRPRGVAVGWAPYRFGHWVWVEPWGWTWVDDAPWGFAPFHYGRWVYVGYWAWVPGPPAVRPVYAPALVAWVGGPRFSLSVSFGGGVAGIGWFPLGPREVYVPAYHASPVYVNRVNITNTTIVNNINITNYNRTNITYVNRNAPNAVTAVPQNTFGTTRRVQDAAVPVQRTTLQSAQVINNAPVAPTRQSVLGYTPASRVAQPPAAIQNRAVVAKTTPPPPRIPFSQRQQILSTNPGRPLEPAQIQQLRSTQPPPARPNIRSAQTNRPVTPIAPSAVPAVQNPPVQRDERRPYQPPPQQPQVTPREDRRFNPTSPPPPQVPPREDRRFNQPPPPAQQPANTPPPRVQPTYTPPPPVQRDVQPAPRVQPNEVPQRREVQQPPPPRQQEERRREVQPPPPRQQETPRVQRESPPPPRQVEERRQAPQKEEKKEEKKDDKKDEKKKQL